LAFTDKTRKFQIINLIMAKNSLENIRMKVAGITLLFILIGILGVLPLWIVQHMYQRLIIKVIIAVAGIVWGVGTIIGLWVRWDYTGLWRKMFKQQRKKRQKRGYENSPEYQALLAKYPISVKRHELHYRKHYPHMSSREVIEKALEISEEEWQKREDFHISNLNERKALKEQKSPTLYKKTDSGQRL